MPRTLTKPQATALYYIELDGGLMKTPGSDEPYSTTAGRSIHTATARWLIENDCLIAHQDGFGFGEESQSWEVKEKMGVVKRGAEP